MLAAMNPNIPPTKQPATTATVLSGAIVRKRSGARRIVTFELDERLFNSAPGKKDANAGLKILPVQSSCHTYKSLRFSIGCPRDRVISPDRCSSRRFHARGHFSVGSSRPNSWTVFQSWGAKLSGIRNFPDGSASGAPLFFDVTDWIEVLSSLRVPPSGRAPVTPGCLPPTQPIG